jgi:TolB-like protein
LYSNTPIQISEEYLNKPIYITHSDTAAGNLNAMIIFLADQLERNIDSKHFSQPAVVSTFVSLDDLRSTSTFGRLISENLTHELQVRKWKVVDIRLSKDIMINKSGEFSLSRDVKNLKGTQNIRAVITGTYSFAQEYVIVNAKVLNVESGVILSTAQMAMPIDQIDSISYDNATSHTMRIRNDR